MPSKVKKPVADKAAKLHVRRGDKVVVLSGDNRGKTGTIIKVFPAENRALVDGDAAIYDTKHIKPNPQANIEGGRQQKLRPIHVSKLALLDPTTNKPTRVKRERTANGVVRVAKKSNHRFETSAK
jgi:large subunit ribosomal protein L24